MPETITTESARELSFVLPRGRLFRPRLIAAFLSAKKSSVLVCVGPYAMTRNPLYFFSFLSWVGAGLAFGAFTLALAVVFLLTHLRTIAQVMLAYTGPQRVECLHEQEILSIYFLLP